MNDATQQRRALAERNAAIFAKNPDVAAIVLVGSTARGECDRFSDIDMSVFYSEMPDERVIDEARTALGISDWKLLGRDETGEFAESFVVDGIECQVGHSSVAQFEQVLADVLERYDTEHDKHVILGGIQEALPLHGASLVEGWQQRITSYPPALAQAMVERHLRFPPAWFLGHRVAGRDTLIVFYRLLLEISQDILGVLLGLNRLYPEHDFKRLDRLITHMTIMPLDLDARLRRILRAEYTPAVQQLAELIDELFSLVEMHMPALDTSEAKKRFTRPEPS